MQNLRNVERWGAQVFGANGGATAPDEIIEVATEESQA